MGHFPKVVMLHLPRSGADTVHNCHWVNVTRNNYLTGSVGRKGCTIYNHSPSEDSGILGRCIIVNWIISKGCQIIRA